MSERIEKLVAELTLDEKAALAAGVDLWHGPGVDRLGIPPLKVTDGPSGARGEQWSGRPSANFPCGTALGATWNTELVHEVGKRLGVEARRKQAHALLAPTVNIHRHPLAGRNFECYSEDPVLSARMAVAYITGVQSQGVGCTVKHFVANDSEFERMTISSEVDERTLREISLVPFEAAVKEAGTWALMTAYNRVNGPYCSEHAELIAMLRDEWGFDGLVMSDWYGTHSTVPAANAGLDLEMPGPPQFFGDKLAAAVRAGEVPESALDDKVHRVLSLMERTGRLDDERPQEVCIDDPIDRAIARRAAGESFVLLQNQRAALPISAATKTLAVIGPNADATVIQGGGSARVTPHPPVSPLAGLRARFAPAGVEVAHERGCYSFKRTPVLEDPVLRGPLQVQYFAGRERAGDPVYEEDSARGLFTFIGPVGHGVPAEFSLKVRGTVVAPETGEWTFTLVQVGRAKLSVDGEVIVDNWNPTGRSDAFMGYGSAEAAGTIALTAGEPHTLEVEFVPPRGLGGLEIGCRPPAPPDLMDRAVALARRADAVVCVVGTDNDWETEGQRPRVDGVAAAAGRARARDRRGQPEHGRRGERRRHRSRCRGPTTSPRSCRPGSRVRSGGTRSPTCCRATSRRRASCRRRFRCASRTRPRSRTTRVSAARCATAKGSSSATAGTTPGASSPASASATACRTRRSSWAHRRGTATRCTYRSRTPARCAVRRRCSATSATPRHRLPVPNRS